MCVYELDLLVVFDHDFCKLGRARRRGMELIHQAPDFCFYGLCT